MRDVLAAALVPPPHALNPHPHAHKSHVLWAWVKFMKHVNHNKMAGTLEAYRQTRAME